jgi:hypothetical protein
MCRLGLDPGPFVELIAGQKAAVMNGSDVSAQYSTGRSRQNIERALLAAGKDPDHLRPADLDMVADFHTMGPIATSQLTQLAKITGEDHVLDAGSGVP